MQAAGGLTNLLFPPSCALCGEELEPPADGIQLCDSCRGKLTESDVLRCPRCASRLPQLTPPGDDCYLCRDVGFHFDRAWTLGDYRKPMSEAVLRLKFARQEPLGLALAEILCRRFSAELTAEQFDGVLNVPLHWWRRARRGANGTELLAGHVARRLSLPHLPRCLVRRRWRTQSHLTPPQRFANVRGAFRLRWGYKIDGGRILLIDDVLTTGATGDAIARILKRAGAAHVAILVAARAQGDR